MGEIMITCGIVGIISSFFLSLGLGFYFKYSKKKLLEKINEDY